MSKDALEKIVLPQIEGLVKKFDALEKSGHLSDWSGVDTQCASEFITASLNAIHRAVGETHPLTKRVEAVVKECSPYRLYAAVPHVGGALRALQGDIKAGYLVSVQELIHTDLFSDFLEMVEHLLGEGCKDAAAVIIGGVLEEHLRKLCAKNGIPTNITDSRDVVKSKKVETMNTDLASAGVYSKGDQKNVTAWYDIRTDAAHGHYTKYTHQQVELLLQSVRDFLTRHPA
jgi:hypothetical protein